MSFRCLQAEIEARAASADSSTELRRFLISGPMPRQPWAPTFVGAEIPQDKRDLFPPGCRPLANTFVRGRRLVPRWPPTASSTAGSFDDSHAVFILRGRRLFGRIEGLYLLDDEQTAVFSVLQVSERPFIILTERLHSESAGVVHDSACEALTLLRDNPFIRCGIINDNSSLCRVPVRLILGPAFYVYSLDADCGVAIALPSRCLPV